MAFGANVRRLRDYSDRDLPDAVGEYPVRWESPQSIPRFDGKVFSLPKKGEAEFHYIEPGRSFLYCRPGHKVQMLCVWGGIEGVNQTPFFRVLDTMPRQAFLEDEESGFFDALKPSAVLLAESQDRSVDRQGTLYVVSLGVTWKDLIHANRITLGKQLHEKSVHEYTIAGTSSALTGKLIEERVWCHGQEYSRVAGGTLSLVGYAAIQFMGPSAILSMQHVMHGEEASRILKGQRLPGGRK